EVVVVALVGADNVADRTGDEEILLDEAQFAAGGGRLAGIEDFGDRLRLNLVLDGLEVVALVEDADVELVRGAGGIETQIVDRLAAVAGDEHVVRHAEDRAPVSLHRAI